MENLYINAHPELVYFPIIDFNAQTGVLQISGESYMEETYKFYEPVFNWLKSYVAQAQNIQFEIRLSYFNTSSSRFILEFLDILKQTKDRGVNVVVNWYYRKSDPDMLSEINDFVEEIGIEINSIETD